MSRPGRFSFNLFRFFKKTNDPKLLSDGAHNIQQFIIDHQINAASEIELSQSEIKRLANIFVERLLSDSESASANITPHNLVANLHRAQSMFFIIAQMQLGAAGDDVRPFSLYVWDAFFELRSYRSHINLFCPRMFNLFAHEQHVWSTYFMPKLRQRGERGI